MQPKQPVVTIRLGLQSLNLSVMMVFFSAYMSPLSPRVAGGLVQRARQEVDEMCSDSSAAGWQMSGVRQHMHTAAERSLGSVAPVGCAQFRQTCTCSQDQKHVKA